MNIILRQEGQEGAARQNVTRCLSEYRFTLTSSALALNPHTVSHPANIVFSISGKCKNYVLNICKYCCQAKIFYLEIIPLMLPALQINVSFCKKPQLSKKMMDSAIKSWLGGVSITNSWYPHLLHYFCGKRSEMLCRPLSFNDVVCHSVISLVNSIQTNYKIKRRKYKTLPTNFQVFSFIFPYRVSTCTMLSLCGLVPPLLLHNL